MTRQRGRSCFCFGVLSIFPILLFSGTLARAQTLYQYDWALRFNNSTTAWFKRLVDKGNTLRHKAAGDVAITL
jgi:hypothetical protein